MLRKLRGWQSKMSTSFIRKTKHGTNATRIAWLACPNEMSPRGLAGLPVNYIVTEDIFLSKENEGASRKVTKRHTALGTTFLPDGLKLKGRKKNELYEFPENLR